MKTAEQKRAWRVFWITNAAVILSAATLYILTVFLATHVGGRFSFCLFHDLLHLYCVSCGATRATWSLLHGDILSALRLHGAVVLTYAALLALDVRGFIRLCRGGTRPFRVHPAFWWSLLALVLGYAILRDVCLVAFHWDWIGDFTA